MAKPIHLIEEENSSGYLCNFAVSRKGIFTTVKKYVTCKNCLKSIKKSPTNPFQVKG